MIREKFFTIWKDPVWSKVISAAIIIFFSLGYNFYIAKFKGISFATAFLNFWSYKVDLWFVATLAAIIAATFFLFNNRFKYDEETLKLDRTLFNHIREDHSIIDFFLEVKSNGFSTRPVDSNRIHTIIEVIEESKKPDYQFFNPRLNKLKNDLIRELENLDSVLSGNIYGAGIGWLSIPSEWEYNQPDRMEKAIADVRKQEDIFTETFQNFITKGRKVLKV